MGEEDIRNLTLHQRLTDAIVTTMGESMLLHQVMLRVPNFDGKNMTLKLFLEDVQSALDDTPEALHANLLKNVNSKLKGLARDAVTGKTISTFEELKDALKEYFSSKKSYPQYCSEIQSVRLNQGETVFNYYHRVKNLVSNAVSSLNEKFNDANEVASMKKLLDGLALESFKRGLPDDLIYAVSVKNPNTLEDAYKIALRTEEDLKGSTARNSNYLRYTQTNELERDTFVRSPRLVSFDDEESRGSIPFFLNRNDNSRPINNRQYNFNSKSHDQPNNYNKNNNGRNGSSARYYHPQYFPHIPYYTPNNNYNPYQYSYPTSFMPMPQFYHPSEYSFPNYFHPPSDDYMHENFPEPNYTMAHPSFANDEDSFKFQENNNQPDEKFSRLAVVQGNYPIVTLHAPEFKNGSARFIVDTGTEVNLIKLSVLKPTCIIAAHRAVALTAITFNKLTTLGSTNISLFSEPEQFQVFKDNELQLSTDGVVGIDFLQNQNARISFKENKLFIKSFSIDFENYSKNLFEPIEPLSSYSYNQNKSLKSLNLVVRKPPVSIATLPKFSNTNNFTRDKLISPMKSFITRSHDECHVKNEVKILLTSLHSESKPEGFNCKEDYRNFQPSTAPASKCSLQPVKLLEETTGKILNTNQNKPTAIFTSEPELIEPAVTTKTSSEILLQLFNNHQIKNFSTFNYKYKEDNDFQFYLNQLLNSSFNEISSDIKSFLVLSTISPLLYYKVNEPKIEELYASTTLSEKNILSQKIESFSPVITTLPVFMFSSGREVSDQTSVLSSLLNPKDKNFNDPTSAILNQTTDLVHTEDLTNDLHRSTGRNYQLLTLVLLKLVCLQRIISSSYLYHHRSVGIQERSENQRHLHLNQQYNLIINVKS